MVSFARNPNFTRYLAARIIATLGDKLPGWLQGHERLYYAAGRHSAQDALIFYRQPIADARRAQIKDAAQQLDAARTAHDRTSARAIRPKTKTFINEKFAAWKFARLTRQFATAW